MGLLPTVKKRNLPPFVAALLLMAPRERLTRFYVASDRHFFLQAQVASVRGESRRAVVAQSAGTHRKTNHPSRPPTPGVTVAVVLRNPCPRPPVMDNVVGM